MRNNPYKTHLKIARSQRNRPQTIQQRLTEMTCEWDGVSGWLETESERLLTELNGHLQALEDQIGDWEKGTDDREGW